MMQNPWCFEKVPKTIGESTILETGITAKSRIVKQHVGYTVFLVAANLHVRETMGIVQRAERCKIEEITLKYKLLNNIGNTCMSSPAGSKQEKTLCFFKNLKNRKQVDHNGHVLATYGFSVRL